MPAAASSRRELPRAAARRRHRQQPYLPPSGAAAPPPRILPGDRSAPNSGLEDDGDPDPGRRAEHVCPLCPFDNERYLVKGDLTRHVGEKHLGKRWQCPHCPLQFKRRAVLKTKHHDRYHGSDHPDCVSHRCLPHEPIDLSVVPVTLGCGCCRMHFRHASDFVNHLAQHPAEMLIHGWSLTQEVDSLLRQRRVVELQAELWSGLGLLPGWAQTVVLSWSQSVAQELKDILSKEDLSPESPDSKLARLQALLAEGCSRDRTYEPGEVCLELAPPPSVVSASLSFSSSFHPHSNANMRVADQKPPASLLPGQSVPGIPFNRLWAPDFPASGPQPTGGIHPPVYSPNLSPRWQWADSSSDFPYDLDPGQADALNDPSSFSDDILPSGEYLVPDQHEIHSPQYLSPHLDYPS